MSFADQLRTAKANGEKQKQEALSKAWEDMLDEVFGVIKTECLQDAKAGRTQSTFSLNSIYGKLTGSGSLESDEIWYRNGSSDSIWVEMFCDRYACKLRYNARGVTYCFSAEDRDSFVAGMSNRCKKDGLSITSNFKEVDVLSLASRKRKPTGLMDELDLRMRHLEPDENGYYTVPASVKSGSRYQISLTISW